jgi:Winged helix-turn-helix
MCTLSHTLTKEYVRLLIEKGLIEYLDGERTFKTTEKGMNFLRIHDRVQGLIVGTPTWPRAQEKGSFLKPQIQAALTSPLGGC